MMKEALLRFTIFSFSGQAHFQWEYAGQNLCWHQNCKCFKDRDFDASIKFPPTHNHIENELDPKTNIR